MLPPVLSIEQGAEVCCFVFLETTLDGVSCDSREFELNPRIVGARLTTYRFALGGLRQLSFGLWLRGPESFQPVALTPVESIYRAVKVHENLDFGSRGQGKYPMFLVQQPVCLPPVRDY